MKSRRYCYLDTTGGGRHKVWDDDYSSRTRSIKTRREDEDEEINSTSLNSSSRRRSRRTREEEEETGRLYSSRRSVNSRREEEINNSRSSSNNSREYVRNTSTRDVSFGSRSSNTRSSRREERNSTRDVVNYMRPSDERRSREDVSYNKRREREDDSSKSKKSRDVSPNSSSHQPVVITDEEEDVDTPVSIRSSKCDDVSCEFCENGGEINARTPAVGSFRGFVDDSVITEILTRLPMKSLLRFKLVCKHWRSMITQDQHFIHLHSTRSQSRPSLLCITPLPQEIENRQTLRQRILTANFSFKTSCGEVKVPQVITHNVEKTFDDNWFHYDYVSEPVKGLVCFIHWGTQAARIYNVSTRQVTPWITSTLLAEEQGKYGSEGNPVKIRSIRRPIYQMGFDPVKKEHKVFCFWRLSIAEPEPINGFCSDSAGYASWEALTVGHDTKWRKISVVPDENNSIKINEVLPRHCPGKSPVHANGSIYWRNKRMSSEFELHHPENVFPDYDPTDPDVIIAFDVGSEKFRVIPIPSFILDEPKKLDRPIAMLVLGGRVTLIYRINERLHF